MPQLKEIFVNIERCVGCKSCTIACAVAHSESKNLFGAISEKPLPKSRIYVEWISPDNKIPIVCRHCEDAPCMHACISGAIRRTDDGIIITDTDKCIGCWTCVMVCPYGVIGRHLEEHKAYRCDRCTDRESPACVDACPVGAIIFRSVDDYSRDIRKNAAREFLSTAKG